MDRACSALTLVSASPMTPTLGTDMGKAGTSPADTSLATLQTPPLVPVLDEAHTTYMARYIAKEVSYMYG